MGHAQAGPIDDHGALTGLADDDHTQYALADGSRGAFATEAQGALADSAVQPADIVVAKIYIEVALSANASPIESGVGKGFARVHTAGTITGFVVDCDPANEPSSIAVQVDLNKVNRTTGAPTSVLSSVASIAIGANTGTGTVNGTQAVAAGDLLSFDIDQGSDGQELIGTVEITPS